MKMIELILWYVKKHILEQVSWVADKCELYMGLNTFTFQPNHYETNINEVNKL